MSKRLIVNADDYGRTPGVSAGIRTAHRNGIVTTTSALANRPSIEQDLRLALGECPNLEIGVHLVLTSGAPLLPSEQIPSITLGRPAFPGLLEQTERARELDPGEVRLEWRAQIEKIVAITGQAPGHLDSHHHYAAFTPELFSVLLDLAREYDSPVRMPAVPLPGSRIYGLPPELLPEIGEFAPRLAASARVLHPDYFVDSFYDDQATQEHMLEVLAALPEGSITEVMCHPAYVDDALLNPVTGSSYNVPRERELSILTGDWVKDFVEIQGIELVTYASLSSD